MLFPIKIRTHERGLLYRKGDFQRVLAPGTHWLLRLPGMATRVERVSVREAYFNHPDLEVMIKNGALEGEIEVVNLMDHERALVWIDGRFDHLFGPGLHAVWNVFHKIHIEVIDARELVFNHPQRQVILNAPSTSRYLQCFAVEAEAIGLFFVDGRFHSILEPGLHAMWKDLGRLRVEAIDQRELTLDINAQDVITADKVTVRLNTLVTFRVTEPRKAVTVVGDYRQALYREAQLALRAAIGTRELDVLLADRDGLVQELDGLIRQRAEQMGLELVSLGLRDIILPGEMKTLMNRVTEAKKAAEANLIARREETAAMRSQANTAKILEANPTLMKLRELEVLEKVAEKANLNVVLGETGLTNHIVKLV